MEMWYPKLIKTNKRQQQARTTPVKFIMGGREEKKKKSEREKKGRENMVTAERWTCAIPWLSAHVRQQRHCRISYGNQPPPPICCLPATFTQYRSRDSLMWAFSITLHCTAVGRINPLVWMHATLNGLAGVPQASSVSCAAIHSGFCVSLYTLPAAVEIAALSHQVTPRLDFYRRWAHYKFSNSNWLCNDFCRATLEHL